MIGFALVACAGRYRTEFAGRGAVGDAPRLAAGTYELALAVAVPRAQVVAWTVTCGEAVVASGQVGETFEHYKERRLADLTVQRDDDRRDAASAAGLVAGVLAPRAKVTVEVAPLPPVSELPAGDVGAARLTARASFVVAGDGACAVRASGADAVAGDYSLTRVHDLAAEAQARTEAARGGAVAVRARVSADLVAAGADATALERRAHAVAVVVEGRRDEAVAARARVVALLETWGAHEREESDPRAVALETRDRISSELIALGAHRHATATATATVTATATATIQPHGLGRSRHHTRTRTRARERAGARAAAPARSPVTVAERRRRQLLVRRLHLLRPLRLLHLLDRRAAPQHHPRRRPRQQRRRGQHVAE